MIRAIGEVRVSDGRVLRVHLPGWPAHAPGQFAMLSLSPDGSSLDPLLPRPMAVFRREGDEVEFRYRVVGRGTARLAALERGRPIGVLGPLGNGFPVPPASEGPAVLVGGGTGIASLHDLAAALGPRARVVLGGRSREDLLAEDAFEALGVDLVCTTEDGSYGVRGRVTDALDVPSGARVFACGPVGMLRAVHERARKAGAHCLVSLENRMACGFGVCLGCAIRAGDGFRYVCTDGPVFDADAVDWDALP